jgi:hypothetical protein
MKFKEKKKAKKRVLRYLEKGVSFYRKLSKVTSSIDAFLDFDFKYYSENNIIDYEALETMKSKLKELRDYLIGYSL